MICIYTHTYNLDECPYCRIKELEQELAATQGKLEQAQADSARLNYVETCTNGLQEGGEGWCVQIIIGSYTGKAYLRLRAAIDAAMQKEAK